MEIHAKRKDGTAVAVGDAVVIYVKGGKRHVGRVREVRGTFAFRLVDRKGREAWRTLQTYRVYCADGVLRPVHARHIKVVLPNKRWRRPDGACAAAR
jgi:hypothetical protein